MHVCKPARSDADRIFKKIFFYGSHLGTRANLNYLDQLAKFHKQHGTNLNRFPSVDKRPLDLYRLKKAVEVRGGFETVCRQKKWAEIGRDLGYSGKIMSSLSTSLKNSYQRWLNPYEEYLRLAKPGVQMKLDHDLGGPITLSPAHSPVKRSTTNTPAGGAAAAGQASTLTSLASSALDLPMPDANDGDDDDDDDGLGGRPTSPVHRSASTPVNRPALTPVNATNGSRRKVDDDRPSSRPSCDVSQGNSSKNTPEHHPWGLGPAINGSISSQRKRRRPSSSNDSPGQSLPGHEDVETNGASEIGGRRSKRLKKGACVLIFSLSLSLKHIHTHTHTPPHPHTKSLSLSLPPSHPSHSFTHFWVGFIYMLHNLILQPFPLVTQLQLQHPVLSCTGCVEWYIFWFSADVRSL